MDGLRKISRRDFGLAIARENRGDDGSARW